MATRSEVRWVVRLTPRDGRTVADLLALPLPLDVWQREADALIVAATEVTLEELERRRLAGVDRLCTTTEYAQRAERLADPGRSGEKP
jgi:hypothetical protein